MEFFGFIQSFLKMDSLEKCPACYLGTVSLPLNIFQFIGIDFFDDPRTCVRNRCKFVLFIICFVTFIFSQVFFLVMIEETGATFIEVANAIPCSFLLLLDIHSQESLRATLPWFSPCVAESDYGIEAYYIDVIKLITLVRKKHLVRNIILDIADIWLDMDSQVESKNKVKDDHLRNLKNFGEGVFKLTIFSVIVYIWITMFVYFVNSIGDEDTPYMFPFTLYYPFKIDSLSKYLAVYLVQSLIGSIIHVCVYHGCDHLMYSLTFDVCIMLRVLEHELVNLKVERKGPGAEQSLTSLKHIVNTHQRLLRFVEDLNDIFGAVMFAMIVFSSSILCFFGFLAIVARAKYQIFINVSTLAQVLFVILYITLPGQILANTSSEFANAAYESSWYDGDSRFRKIIYIIIARSQKQCALRAMGYTDMNFTTYCKICSSAWSYLSLVNQMYQNVEFEF